MGPTGVVTGRSKGSIGNPNVDGAVIGRVTPEEDAWRVELQITAGGETLTYSGRLEGNQVRGRVYEGGRAQGRWSLNR